MHRGFITLQDMRLRFMSPRTTVSARLKLLYRAANILERIALLCVIETFLQMVRELGQRRWRVVKREEHAISP